MTRGGGPVGSRWRFRTGWKFRGIGGKGVLVRRQEVEVKTGRGPWSGRPDGMRSPRPSRRRERAREARRAGEDGAKLRHAPGRWESATALIATSHCTREPLSRRRERQGADRRSRGAERATGKWLVGWLGALPGELWTSWRGRSRLSAGGRLYCRRGAGRNLKGGGGEQARVRSGARGRVGRGKRGAAGGMERESRDV